MEMDSQREAAVEVEGVKVAVRWAEAAVVAVEEGTKATTTTKATATNSSRAGETGLG